jgi:hypothetical protein
MARFWQRLRNKWYWGLLALLLVGVGTGFYFWGKTRGCVFADRVLCWQGERYEKYNWQGSLAGRAYKFGKKQKIVTPFDGFFTYSPSGFVNFQEENMGKTPVLIFENDKDKTVRLYVEGADLLVGKVGETSEVKKGEVVAEVWAGKIGFLDDYSLVEIQLPK